MSNIRRLNKFNFEEYPVWGWTEDESGYIPILDTSSLPLDRGPLLVRAQLLPSSGPALDGYVVGLASIYAIGVFSGNARFVFNIHMDANDVIETASELFTALGTKPFKLFPIQYKTIFSYSDGTMLEGTFSMKSCDI